MSLIECPECGKEVSSEAESCPHCGHPIKKKFQSVSYNYDEGIIWEYNARTIGSFIGAGISLISAIIFIVLSIVNKDFPLLYSIFFAFLFILVAALGIIIGIYRWKKTH